LRRAVALLDSTRGISAPVMNPEKADQYGFDRQVALARFVFVVLMLVELLTVNRAAVRPATFLLCVGYLVVAVIILSVDEMSGEMKFRLPLAVDVVALGVFLIAVPAAPALWFFYGFVTFAATLEGQPRLAWVVGGVTTAAVVARGAWRDPLDWQHGLLWGALGVGTIAIGALTGFVGARERRHVAEDRFLERLPRQLRVEHGLAESIRMVLDEVAREFTSELVVLAVCDSELERVFAWTVRVGEKGPIAPETFALTRADAFLADDMEKIICWNSIDGKGEGFGWNRADGTRLNELPRLPNGTRELLKVRSFLAVTLESEGKPAGRVLVLNGTRKYTEQDLRWCQQIVRHVSPPLENVFLLRHLRTRAVEAERSRISRDLHDGTLQTLLSLNIQLDVLRRKLPNAPEQADGALGALQKIVQQEGDELRRLVTEMRPLRVESADLVELMGGFAERFRNEASLALDLFVDGNDLRVPDRVCRELFQIYRESLNNIKKHAQASHVVVKLWQDETKVFLVVDDNGQGFSFAGSYSSEELDRLRLGPISIKERTRSVGGMLTVESSPGHGARLTVQIPLS
jgi:signal transduction histidine kinase